MIRSNSKLEYMGVNHRGRVPGTVNKKSLLAEAELRRLEAEPIAMLVEVYKQSMEAYEADKTNGGGKGAAYLATACAAASKLASFRYPTLSAISIKDLDLDQAESRPMTTREAIEIIKSDPFFPKS